MPNTFVISQPRYRAGAAGGLAEMELVSLRSGRFLNQQSWEQFEQGYLVYRAANIKLGTLALEKKQPRWRQRPKSHSLEHACNDFHGANLRFLSNYLDEDFVRRTKRLALSSSPKFASRHVLFRWSVAATLRWTQLKPQ